MFVFFDQNDYISGFSEIILNKENTMGFNEFLLMILLHNLRDSDTTVPARRLLIESVSA
jgi:hypothetical protein